MTDTINQKFLVTFRKGYESRVYAVESDGDDIDVLRNILGTNSFSGEDLATGFFTVEKAIDLHEYIVLPSYDLRQVR